MIIAYLERLQGIWEQSWKLLSVCITITAKKFLYKQQYLKAIFNW